MKIKVGNLWFETRPGQGILVELTEDEHAFVSLAQVHKGVGAVVAVTHVDDARSAEELHAWMNAPRPHLESDYENFPSLRDRDKPAAEDAVAS